MSVVPSYPLTRERNLILGSLLVLAAAGWAVLIWQSQIMDDEDMGLTMGMSAPLFIAIWAAMMVAIYVHDGGADDNHLCTRSGVATRTRRGLRANVALR